MLTMARGQATGGRGVCPGCRIAKATPCSLRHVRFCPLSRQRIREHLHETRPRCSEGAFLYYFFSRAALVIAHSTKAIGAGTIVAARIAHRIVFPSKLLPVLGALPLRADARRLILGNKPKSHDIPVPRAETRPRAPRREFQRMPPLRPRAEMPKDLRPRLNRTPFAMRMRFEKRNAMRAL